MSKEKLVVCFSKHLSAGFRAGLPPAEFSPTKSDNHRRLQGQTHDNSRRFDTDACDFLRLGIEPKNLQHSGPRESIGTEWSVYACMENYFERPKNAKVREWFGFKRSSLVLGIKI